VEGLLVLLFVALVIAMQVLWIVMLIEVCRLPEQQFVAAGTERITWVIVIALLGFLGALAWCFSKRRAVLDAEGFVPAAVAPAAPHVPAGWYAEPGGTSLRWWDGVRWSEHRQAIENPTADLPD
jgi:hypothetical protein